MFLVRSAFWLSIAFSVIAPLAGTDAPSVARATGEEIAHRGAGAVTSHLVPESCGAIECVLGRALIAETLPTTRTAPVSPVVESSEPVVAEGPLAPLPPQRPLWAY